MTFNNIKTSLVKFKSFMLRLASFRPLWAILYVTFLPVLFVHDLLLEVWRSGVPRAWDGTGHYGIAQIYAQSVFPDTFGWTQAHFAGMPFPNFYPPLFFWCAALLQATRLVSLLTAFKFLSILPLVLIPAAIWLLAWSVSNRDQHVAFWAALSSVLPVTSPSFGGQMEWASGLDYFSTLSIGMYTQPLGFILLLGWYAVYVSAHDRVWRFVLSSVLLALALLASFLNGMIGVLIVAATVLFDIVRCLRRSDPAAPRALVAHLLSPAFAVALALFWLMPMLSTYEYFVTRPFTLVILTRSMIAWAFFALVGSVCWIRHATRATYPYLVICVALAAILIFAASVGPRWLPLQANRISPILYFLVVIPIGYAVTTIYKYVRDRFFVLFPRLKPLVLRLTPYALSSLLIVIGLNYYLITQRPDLKAFYKYEARLGFYPPPGAAGSEIPAVHEADTSSATLNALQTAKPSEIKATQLFEVFKREHQNDLAVAQATAFNVNSILSFARNHHDGRYLVEIPSQYSVDAASFDGRALNSYLGAQGNQTLTIVFREASVNSLFMFPQVSALSYNPDNFGFSSVLGDDLDFATQSLAKHLGRLQYLGTRYLVINSPKMKERLAQEPGVGARADFGNWSVFELRDAPPPPIRVLPFRPALLVSSFTVKGRRSDQSSFIRYAEEQFADGWFDVLLVRAPTTNLDGLGSLEELNGFGAIILDAYECNRCDLVYRQLKAFAQSRPLILLAEDKSLFNRIRYSLGDFPQATIIERDRSAPSGEWLDQYGPSRHYQKDPRREEWARIRDVLESHKIPSEPVSVEGEIKQHSIQITYSAPSPPTSAVPVLISTTYHPNWQAEDFQTVYAANPMFMLVFVRQSTHLTFARRWWDRVAIWISAVAFLALIGVVVVYRPKRFAWIMLWYRKIWRK